VQTGPLLFKTSGPLVYTIFGGLLIANIVMLVAMFFGIRFFSKILSIRKTLMLPVVMVLCIVGAFAINNRMFDVWSVLGFGVLGYLLNKVEIPFGPIVMGFILGPIVELYLRRGVMISEGSLMPFITATSEDANNVISYIRSTVKKVYGEEAANAIRIQYGGSMKPENAADLMAMSDIDGGLVGGASLKAEDFANIINF
jgi:TctA family transporter